MAKYRNKRAVVTALTFDELVAHGIEQCKKEGRESNIVNGFPWSFTYGVLPVTHEANTRYLVGSHTVVDPQYMLVIAEDGEVYSCHKDTFNTLFDVCPEPENKHTVSELYQYALARLGLKDAPDLRVLFWDAHNKLEWDDERDTLITPTTEDTQSVDYNCTTCGAQIGLFT